MRPEQVIAQLNAPSLRQRFGITEAGRHPDLPRLLVIRVGPRWGEVPERERRDAAERWRRLWRHTVAQGIVAILDAASERPLVGFDGRGNATLKDRAPAPHPSERLH